MYILPQFYKPNFKDETRAQKMNDAVKVKRKTEFSHATYL